MTKIADHINIRHIDREGVYLLEIDGEAFPYYLAENGIKVEMGTPSARGKHTQLPMVTLRIPATRITLDDDLRNSLEAAA